MQNYNSEIKTEILNQTKAFGRSEKYKIFSTNEALESLERLGFEKVKVDVARANKKERHGFQKHIVTLENQALTERWQSLQGGEEIPRLHVLNSYDGTSSLKFFFGLYRLVCSNGMVVGEDFYSESFRHVGGDFHKKVKESIERLPSQIERVARLVNYTKSIQLVGNEIESFAVEALQLRDPNAIDSMGLAEPVRTFDESNSLWHVFNRVQEKMIERRFRGLEKYRSFDQDHGVRERTLRLCKSPIAKNELNRKLFDQLNRWAKAA